MRGCDICQTCDICDGPMMETLQTCDDCAHMAESNIRTEALATGRREGAEGERAKVVAFIKAARLRLGYREPAGLALELAYEAIERGEHEEKKQ